MAALPAIATGLPLVDELDTADKRHDGLGAAIWFLLEAYLRHPDTTPAMVEAAKKIRAAFIPTLEELGASYEAEAKAAMDRKPDLTKLEAELKMFPVGGATLYDWATAFLAAGEHISTLLSARADAKDRKAATRLRAETIGALNRLRKTLALEMKHDPKLPADLDAQVFGYFDLLEAKAAGAQTAGKEEDEAPAPPPPAAPATPQGGEGKGP
jgi:hypothetical protein